MPEGHLYHRRDLNEFTGRALAACSPQGRFAEGAAQINGTAATDTPLSCNRRMSNVSGSRKQVSAARASIGSQNC